MVAVEGLYDNGKIMLLESAPMEKARVILVFPEPKKENGKRLSTDEARALFDEFSGCLDGDINEQAERLGALDEKFENIDTNIILDRLLHQEPFHSNAKYIVEKCMSGGVDGYLTAHMMSDLFYILRKELLIFLCDTMEIISEDKETIRRALQGF